MTKLRIVKMTNTGYDQIVLRNDPVCAACFKPIKGSYNYWEKKWSVIPPEQDDWSVCGKCFMRIHKTCGDPERGSWCCPFVYD